MSKDFKFVRDLFEDFLSQDYMEQMFSLIVEDEIKDWEKWFQIEFAHYLKYRSDKVRNPRREARLLLRTNQAASDNPSKKATFIDFIIERKNTAPNGKILIEIKNKNSVNNCIKGMIHDTRLLKSPKGKRNVRSIFAVGIHPPEDDKHSIDEKLKMHKATNLFTRLKGDTFLVPGAEDELQISILTVSD